MNNNVSNIINYSIIIILLSRVSVQKSMDYSWTASTNLPECGEVKI
jgi:hypothetical protein